MDIIAQGDPKVEDVEFKSIVSDRLEGDRAVCGVTSHGDGSILALRYRVDLVPSLNLREIEDGSI